MPDAWLWTWETSLGVLLGIIIFDGMRWLINALPGLRDRLCGLISRQFGVTAFPTQPFRFLSFSQGNALIEGLKSLAERKELEYLHSDRYRREREAAGK